MLVERCSSVSLACQPLCIHKEPDVVLLSSLPFNSPRRARNSFLSSSTRFLPRSINASNLIVNSAMRLRRSSKLKSTDGSWVSGLSEYDMAGVVCDCDARNEDVLAENDEGGTAVDMFALQLCILLDTDQNLSEDARTD